MHYARIAALLLAVSACRKGEESPKPAPAPAPAQQQAPVTAAPATPPPVPAEAPAPAEPEWKPPLTPAELKGLDGYAGFSGDGLVFAYSNFSDGAGLFIMTFQSSTTNTIEKTVPLANDDVRRQIAQELSEDGFPKPGTPPKIPPVVGTVVTDGKVSVTFSGMPATKPFVPFTDVPNATLGTAEVAALSKDGKRAAVRLVSKQDITEFGPARVYRVVTLFE